MSKLLILIPFALFLSNFSALAQKTNVWIVNNAEKAKGIDALSDTGKERAVDLFKALKHDDVQVIYITPKKISAETAEPLATRDKILPRVYTDSVQKFAQIIKLNFIGKNVLIVANYDTIIPLISALGGETPFDELDKGDHDQLFCLTIKSTGDVDCTVRYYGKKHHINEIPQSYILENYSQGIPGR
ncbi:histidine phosphatase family protein [Mucilaginibacter sp. L196]|uniref:histidine phosphatase family protein n=1 Tax=Mucilaginibacter sp. L196 TaxID=1641870 RepID=UPI001C208CA5|nr:histidine phosphatase family protein [Mucilaginibacter sp. L196]